MNLAIFHLDNTLLNGDSDYNWSLYLIEKGLLDSKTHATKNQQFYTDYQSGKLDIFEFIEFQFKALKDNPRMLLDDLRKDYVEEIITPMITQKAFDLVEHHRILGDHLLIITATNSYITSPIGLLFGIQDLIGTDPEEDDNGEFTGKATGIPSFKSGKVKRLEDWLTKQNLSLSDFEKSYFYSDSHNDLPLLEKVSHPVAVNPDEELSKVAIANNWPTMDLR
ncbi:MAG: HAD family hydrolase [Methylophilaceae bacterium]